MNKPTVGRTVLYVMPEGHSRKGAVRPAVITQVWSDTCVNLHVLHDPSNDEPVDASQTCSVAHDDTATQPRSFHWPPRN